MQSCTRFSLFALVLAYSAAAAAAAAAAASAQTGDGVRESLREQVLVAQKNAQISSAARLDSYLAVIPVDSPLTLLSVDGLEQFLTSLSFNENGLVGYSTEAIASELSYSQAHRLLSLFGAERTLRLMPGLRVENEVDLDIHRSYVQSGELVEDHMGYRCVARATCRESTEYVCMAGC